MGEQPVGSRLAFRQIQPASKLLAVVAGEGDALGCHGKDLAPPSRGGKGRRLPPTNAQNRAAKVTKGMPMTNGVSASGWMGRRNVKSTAMLELKKRTP